MMKLFRVAAFDEEAISDTFAKGSYETLISDTLDIDSDFNGTYSISHNIEDSLIISKLMAMLLTQRYYASIIGYNLTAASNTAKSIIYNSFDKYGVQIRTLNDNIDRLITVKSSIKQSTNIDKTTSTIEDEATDTIDNQVVVETSETQDPNEIVSKRNDTPNAGNNPDLLTDRYLTGSTRNTETLGDKTTSIDDQRFISNVIGERKRANQELASMDDNYILTVHDNDIQSIKELLTVIDSIYQQWISYLDRTMLTYDMSSL